MIYGGFEIQSFEAGRGLWHARIQRADLAPVVIDGMSFPTLEVGFAWSDPDAAIADAKAISTGNRQRYTHGAFDGVENGHADDRKPNPSRRRNLPDR